MNGKGYWFSDDHVYGCEIVILGGNLHQSRMYFDSFFLLQKVLSGGTQNYGVVCVCCVDGVDECVCFFDKMYVVKGFCFEANGQKLSQQIFVACCKACKYVC